MYQKTIAATDPQIPEAWRNPSDIQKITEYLAACETLEMLAELRGCAVPPVVFRAAAKRLEPSKRKQIKDWVLLLNKA